MKQENSVTLLGYYGGDKTHCLSAWTSTFEDLGIVMPESVPDRVDAMFEYICNTKKKTPSELLEMLASAGHHTPFEKSSVHFMVNTDIASHIHILKHRIGISVNAESARYKELKDDKFIVPNDWVGIPVSDSEIARRFGATWDAALENFTNTANFMYHECLKDIEQPLGRKRAKESARYFKAYNSQIQADVMFNWRSLYHFLKLRNKPEAQKEIREIAAEMLKQVRGIDGNPFKDTIKAFGFDKETA